VLSSHVEHGVVDKLGRLESVFGKIALFLIIYIPDFLALFAIGDHASEADSSKATGTTTTFCPYLVVWQKPGEVNKRKSQTAIVNPL
jgi:hypothetical protein